MTEQAKQQAAQLPAMFYFVNIPADFNDMPFAVSLMHGNTAIAAVYECKEFWRVVSCNFDFRFHKTFKPEQLGNAEWLGKLITETMGYELPQFY